MSRFIAGAESPFPAVADHLIGQNLLAAVEREAWLQAACDAEAAIVAKWQDAAADDRGRKLLAICVPLLAIRQAAQARGIEDRAIVETLRAVIVEPRRAYVHEWLSNRLGISAARPAEAFAQAKANFKSGGEAFFGDRFTYHQTRASETESFVEVHHCFFNEFFTREGAPALTGVLCALDTIWADVLNDGGYNVRFERPRTLAQSGQPCQFHFFRR